MSMSMTKALHTAAQHISQPAGCGTTWRLYGPFYSTEAGLRGPTTDRNARSYAQAREARTVWVAELALALIGVEDHAIGWMVNDARERGCTTARDIVLDVLSSRATRALGRTPTEGVHAHSSIARIGTRDARRTDSLNC